MRATGFAVVLKRQLRAAGSAWWTLAAAAFVAATVLAAAPGLLERTADAQLQHELGQLSPNLRCMTGLSFVPPPLGPPAVPGGPEIPAQAAPVWGALGDQLMDLRGRVPEPLRGVLGPPRFTITGESQPLPPPPAGVPPGELHLRVAVDPYLAESATLTSGSWPAPAADAKGTPSPWPMVMSVQSAARFGWRIGEVRRWGGADSPFSVELSGIFQAKSVGDEHWQLYRSVLQPEIKLGTSSDTITAIAFVHPSTWTLVDSNLPPSGQLRITFALSPGSVPVDQADQIRAQLDSFTSVTQELPSPDGAAPGTLSALRLTSQTPAALGRAIEVIAASRSVLSVIAVGPGLAALTVLVMAAAALSRRRRPHHHLLTARGVPWSGLRTRSALEGVAVTALPAAAGVAVAFRVLPPASPGPAVLLAGLTLVVVVGTLAVAPRPVGAAREENTAPALRSGPRRVLQLAVLGATVVAVVLLWRSRTAAGAPLDPVIVAVPILLAVAAGIAVQWLLPGPLRILAALLRRRRGLIGFLGAARAVRGRSAGFALSLALLVAVSSVVFSVSLLSTLTRGVSAAARSTVGADIGVQALTITPEQVIAAAGQPGVQLVSPIDVKGNVTLRVAGLECTVTVYLVDTATLTRVQAGVSGAIDIPAGMNRTAGPVPVLVSSGFLTAMQAPVTAELTSGGHPLRVVGTAPAADGFSPARDWVLADRTFAADFGADPTDATALLLRLTPTADPAAVAGRLQTQLPDATIAAAQQTVAALLASPSVRGAETAAVAALAVTLLLGVVAVGMAAVAGTSARTRVVMILRTLGLPRRAVSRLTAWEFLPPAAGALLGGTLTGLALLGLIHRVVDLRPYTGGRTQPPVTISVLQLGAVLGILVVVIAAAITGASLAARRTVTLVDRLETR